MARVAKPSKITRSATASRKTGAAKTVSASAASRRSAPMSEKRKPGRPAKVTAALPKKTAKASAAPAAPKVSKDELRAHVEKLEHLVATLRAKSRETNKAAKAATARIAELEAQVAQLEKKAAAAPPPVRAAKPPRPARARHESREIDPGDAVPPGVAVQEPQPLDEEAETALENLETHLDHD